MPEVVDPNPHFDFLNAIQNVLPTSTQSIKTKCRALSLLSLRAMRKLSDGGGCYTLSMDQWNKG
jgi:hypothetical protein